MKRHRGCDSPWFTGVTTPRLISRVKQQAPVCVRRYQGGVNIYQKITLLASGRFIGRVARHLSAFLYLRYYYMRYKAAARANKTRRSTRHVRDIDRERRGATCVVWPSDEPVASVGPLHCNFTRLSGSKNAPPCVIINRRQFARR